MPLGPQLRALPGALNGCLRNLPEGFDHAFTLEVLDGSRPGLRCELSLGEVVNELQPKHAMQPHLHGMAVGQPEIRQLEVEEAGTEQGNLGRSRFEAHSYSGGLWHPIT